MHSEPAPGFIKHPQHKVALKQLTKSYQLLFNGDIIAQSSKVIELDESRYGLRLYFPIADVEMVSLVETDHVTYCPFKGQARYWTLRSAAGNLENGVWAYDKPYQECHPLIDHLCFYTEKAGFELRELQA